MSIRDPRIAIIGGGLTFALAFRARGIAATMSSVVDSLRAAGAQA